MSPPALNSELRQQSVTDLPRLKSVAYSVCSTLGLDTAASATPYMATWGDGSEIEHYGQLIDTLATRIEDALLGDADAEPREEAVAVAA